MKSKPATRISRGSLPVKDRDNNLRGGKKQKHHGHLSVVQPEQALKNALDGLSIDMPLDEFIYKIVRNNSHMPAKKRDLSLEHPHYVMLACVSKYTELLRQEVLRLRNQMKQTKKPKSIRGKSKLKTEKGVSDIGNNVI